MVGTMQNATERILLELGIRPNLKGFLYICEAVEIINNNPKCMLYEIYEVISKKFDCTANSIGVAIAKAYKKAEPYSYPELTRGNPTSSEFLYTLALIVRRETENGK